MVKRKIGQEKKRPTEETYKEDCLSKCTVQSFYGKKSTNLRLTKRVSVTPVKESVPETASKTPNKKPVSKTPIKIAVTRSQLKKTPIKYVKEDDIKPISNRDEQATEVLNPNGNQQPVKRFYKRNDVFWTSNIYGKKRKNEIKHNEDVKKKQRKVNIESNEFESPLPKKHELMTCSAETQTSFSSSQESNQQSNCSSPVVLARSSPFINCNESVIDSSINESSKIDCSLNESSEIDDNEIHSDDSEPYEMFNCDTSSQLDSSFRSEGKPVSPQKITPTRKKTPTILNYFAKVESGKISNKLTSPTSDNDVKKKKDPKQMHFSKKGLASKKAEESEEGILFDLPTTSTRTTPRAKKKAIKNKNMVGTPKEQMYIDVGQKDFGHVKCDTCGMVYTKSQEEDEEQHAKYHQRIVQKLRFKGWKNERVLEEFPDGRIASIQHSDHFMHLKKLNEIREVVDTELGFATSQERDLKQDERAYLFISSKKVIGCVIAVPISKGYPIIPESNAGDNDKEKGEAAQSWCCSTESVKALCGISRIWVFSKNRRQKIATRIVECIRRDFLYGCIIDKKYLAFSDPTPNGRIFAENYIGKKDVLVFR